MNNLITFPNQKVVVVEDDSLHDEKPYSIITERERIWAGRLLNDKTASHIIYCCLAGHSNGYEFALSPTAINKYYGISKKQYHSAIKALLEVGYLVQKSKGSNIWIFKRIPDMYKNLELIVEETTEDTTIEIQNEIVETEQNNPIVSDVTTDTSPLPGISCATSGDKICPQEREDIYLHGTEIINNIINNNINNNIPELDSINLYPEDKDTVIASALDISADMCENIKSPIDIEKEKIIEEFGDSVDDLPLEFVTLDCKANGKKLSEAEHIKLYRKLYDKLQEERRFRIATSKNEYMMAIEETFPRDSIDRMKVKLIIDKYIETHKASGFDFQKCREHYGLWIDGWDEELKEPKIKFALNELPIDLAKKQKHRYEAVPKEYYINK